ncbi:hypothetical protein OV079_47530 [Nannocystis pusilla]|uniref:Uncharacterized protein n=1 Tax=Nannocystis pusilla TaxID=889268 RepID=A0A9X3J1T3_9BACT|nr:hypothetical protein [Nannocystis pusilla]MCY1013062.1 hypothetical protein [Nannocystis pusilla]
MLGDGREREQVGAQAGEVPLDGARAVLRTRRREAGGVEQPGEREEAEVDAGQASGPGEREGGVRGEEEVLGGVAEERRAEVGDPSPVGLAADGRLGRATSWRIC